MLLQERFYADCPESFFLSMDQVSELQAYLQENGWMKPDESIKSLAKAGESNMNLVIRVDTGRRTFIVKQSRPWVEKYPHIDAPEERTNIEAKFFELIQSNEALLQLTPPIIGNDKSSFVLVMEDLGHAGEMTDLYQREIFLDEDNIVVLVDFLSILHQSFNSATTSARIANSAMRALNHEHLFVYPFLKDNGLDLDTVTKGLEKVANPFKQDQALKSRIMALGEIYLGEGDTLLHGDYYPGSWLKTKAGIKIIDPEFGFFGPKEFDLAIMLAHVRLARQPDKVIEKIREKYALTDQLDISLMNGFMGVEIIRRIIGLAQLPLTLSLNRKEQLLEEARTLIMKGSAKN